MTKLGFALHADDDLIAPEGNIQTIYVAECRNRIKMSDDRDCLPADAVRIETRLFPSNAAIFRAAIAYQKRGFDVCVDTSTIDCYEFEAQ